MSKLPRILAILTIIGGAIMIPLGAATYYLVQRELADEKIVVSDDADNFAGEKVEGPLTAYSEAMVIKKHALEIGEGQTYAELPRDDPRRPTVMDSSFLRTSLFTSVVSFGVAALVIALGVMFIILGIAVLGLDKSMRRTLATATANGGGVPLTSTPTPPPPPAGDTALTAPAPRADDAPAVDDRPTPDGEARSDP